MEIWAVLTALQLTLEKLSNWLFIHISEGCLSVQEAIAGAMEWLTIVLFLLLFSWTFWPPTV